MQTKSLIFDVYPAIIGTWSESHGSSGNASDKRIFYTSFTGGSGNNQYLTRSLLPAFSATSGLSEKGRKIEKKVIDMNNLLSNQESLVSIKHNTVITTSNPNSLDNKDNNRYDGSTKIRSGYRTRRGEFSTFTADENRKYTNIGQPLRGLVESATCSYSGGNTKTEGLTMQNLSLLDQDLVVIKNNQPITTSKQIAITFGKTHRHVLDSVRNLATSTPAEFAQPNFRLSTYRDNSGKSNPVYELTRDGFTLLAMGFTGKRALEFKLAYINAFNEMERKLAEPKTITVKSHTRKLPSKAPQPKSKVLDVEACGIPVCEQMPIAGAMWDFMRGAQSVAELDKRRDYMMRGIINMHAHNSMRLQGLQGLIKEVR